MSKLDQGVITIGKSCPWLKQCPIAINGQCRRGAKRDTNFSCGAARAFDIGGVPTDKAERED